jgi:hypothetical protein
MARLQARGTAILFISHKLDEVDHVASRAVVLRDGAVVGTPDLAEVRSQSLVGMMVGRSIENLFPYVPTAAAEERLVVERASDGGLLKEASLNVGLPGWLSALSMASGEMPCPTVAADLGQPTESNYLVSHIPGSSAPTSGFGLGRRTRLEAFSPRGWPPIVDLATLRSTSRCPSNGCARTS